MAYRHQPGHRRGIRSAWGRVRAFAAGTCVVGITVVGVAAAAVAQSAAQSNAEAGEIAYQDACAACHGPDGQGNGPNAAMIATAVPDLTRLAARNDGTYDIVRVILTIDGRAGLAAHGGPMPLFGGLLTGPAVVIDGPDGDPVATTEPILAIARWLETRQEPAQ